MSDDDDRPCVVLRGGVATDHAHVRASWCETCDLEGGSKAREREVLRRIARGTIIVAAYDADPDVILGWICVRGGTRDGEAIVDYVHVKPIYRGHGIARLLVQLAGATVIATARTERALPDGWRHDPWV